jgi:hypothetical protein
LQNSQARFGFGVRFFPPLEGACCCGRALSPAFDMVEKRPATTVEKYSATQSQLVLGDAEICVRLCRAADSGFSAAEKSWEQGAKRQNLGFAFWRRPNHRHRTESVYFRLVVWEFLVLIVDFGLSFFWVEGTLMRVKIMRIRIYYVFHC